MAPILPSSEIDSAPDVDPSPSVCRLGRHRAAHARLQQRHGVWWAIVTMEDGDGQREELECSLGTRDAASAQRLQRWLLAELRC